jgi:hypothetical protein
MGYDAACTIRIEGKRARGTAWLEHKDLIFRGPFRVAIPLKDIRSARAEDGILRVAFGGREAELEIGPAAAAKWAARITNPPSRIQKLGVKAGMRVALVGVDDAQFDAELAACGADVSRRAGSAGAADAVFYEANRREDLARLSSLVKAIKPDGAIWILRPKGRPEIGEADTMAAGRDAGLVDVKVVSFSDAYSAEKYVVPRGSRPRAPVSAAARRAGAGRSSSPSARTRRSASSRGRT